MKPSPGTHSSLSDMPDVLAELQTRVETLYADKLSLEQQVRQLRAAPPVVMARAPRRTAVTRVLHRLVPPLRRRAHLALIRDSGLFDAAWYLKTYPDVAQAGVDPARHFLTQGLAERRDPGPLFDTEHYLHLYPDIEATGINPLVHYVVAGRAEHRSIRPGMQHGGR